MVRAKWAGKSRVPWSNARGEEHEFPLFTGRIGSDVRFFGFGVSIEDARGGGVPTSTYPTRPGWFVAFQEQPTEPRFGMDDGDTDPIDELGDWADLGWTSVGVPDGEHLVIGEIDPGAIHRRHHLGRERRAHGPDHPSDARPRAFPRRWTASRGESGAMADPRSRRRADVTATERQARAIEADVADARSRLRALRSIDPVGSEARALEARVAELEEARLSALQQARDARLEAGTTSTEPMKVEDLDP